MYVKTFKTVIVVFIGILVFSTKTVYCLVVKIISSVIYISIIFSFNLTHVILWVSTNWLILIKIEKFTGPNKILLVLGLRTDAHQYIMRTAIIKNLTYKISLKLLLCKYERYKMSKMHCLRWRTSACVKKKWLLLFYKIQYLMHISEKKIMKSWIYY
jgi:hypothetical protein